MIYKPKTTEEQRAALSDVVSAKLPHLKNAMRDLLEDLERAEKALRDYPRIVAGIKAGERLDASMSAHTRPAYSIGKDCLHPSFEWDTHGVRCVRRCTYCGAEEES